ncbi:MAG: DUF3179 domain-containing protein [Balneolaceae bacterium]|nr:DUF3179 domain-containing protein [Balneolaceae bacterium]MCH8549914.1 DUF3179 domain-containing protein [Balneolaceae bacterium]
MKKSIHYIVLIVATFGLLTLLHTASEAQSLPGFDTNLEKRSIELSELIEGGPGKDGIPSIDSPRFISQEEASDWLRGREPVIAIEINGEARAYPIQILMWHEIVNDELGGEPILVTFCPLCYSAIVFDRRIDGEIYEFGVSGLLRKSDMIMYDRTTETLWQQFSGEALVGDYTGKELTILPSRLISFDQFRETWPEAEVLSRETGHRRNYGENPYAGYDDIKNSPFLLDEEVSGEISPMEKVIGVRTDAQKKGYTYSVTRVRRVLHDEVGGKKIVIFHLDGMASAMDQSAIHQSRDDGATGVFSPYHNGEKLTFEYRDGDILDRETGSTWNISGKATSGSLEGEQLETMLYGDYFAFAWLVFYPETDMLTKENETD